MMSALGAFLRGVGGAGLIDQAQYMRRQQEIDQARLERQRELDESRKWREQEREADRQAMLERSTLGRARSGGGGGASDDAGEQSSLAIARLMQGDKESGIPPMSRAEAGRIVESSMTGENPLTAVRKVPQQIDDGDRMRTVTTETTEPDVERWLKLNRMIGKALEEERPISKSNYDQYQGGLQKAAVTAGAFSKDQAQERGALLAQGKSPFDDGSSVLTGEAAPRSVANAKIASEGALAGKRNADARSAGTGVGAKGGVTVQRVITTENGDAVAVMRDGTTRNLGIRTPDFNKEVSRIAARMAKEDVAFANLAPDEQRERATQAFLGSKPAAPAPAAKPASTLKALPPGAKQIGTSKGKPVYETPDGKRFIGG